MRYQRSSWLLAGAIALAGCVESNDGGGDEPAPDMATAPAPDAAMGGAGGGAGGGEGGGAGAQPDAEIPDMALPTPDMEPPPEDGCADACERMLNCTVEVCEGADSLNLGALSASCAATCEGTPAFAVVVEGAEGCEDVVDFSRAQGFEGYAEACAPAMPPPDPMSCPYPCEGEEVCIGGRCLRPDGTCETDYHCEVGVTECREGECRPAQFSRCMGADDCDEGQRCERFGAGGIEPGYCVINCEQDTDCPINEGCTQGFCNYVYCGMVAGNGQVNGGCTIANGPGVCFPLPLGDPANPVNYGVCIDGGAAAEGEACDAQAESRDEAGAALRCEAGAFCFGDPDDPLQPGATLEGLGECTALCNPRRGDTCAEGRACVDFSNGDDPMTQGYDETRVLGLCLRSDCTVTEAGGCEVGQACRPYTILVSEGVCEPTGPSAFGEPCEAQEDCAEGFCNAQQDGSLVCMDYCALGAADCGPGSVCFEQPGWAWGICFPIPGDPPPPEDGGMEPPEGDADAGVEPPEEDAGE